jgi:uroporphyrinogen decarboxylase
MTGMTSRERFRTTLNHREPDRVPIEVASDLHNGIHAVAYKNLLDYLGDEDQIVYYDQMQHLAVCKEGIKERLHADTRYIFANAPESYQLNIQEDESWLDEWGVRRKNFGLYDENVEAPLRDLTWDKVKSYRIPDAKDASRYRGLRERARELYETTDYALVAGSPASLFFLSSELVGFQEFMEKLATEPKLIETLVDKVLEFQIEFFRRYLEEIHEFIEMAWMGDDWGTQLGPIMSPKQFREIFVRRYKVFIDSIRKRFDTKIAIHACGSVYYALKDFIEAGIGVVHPLQGDAAEMDPVRLKNEFGKDLVLYSNISNQGVLPNGTAEDVKREVLHKLKILAPGGGYIISGGHNIQADVPPENILALFDTAFVYGKYPIRVEG